jgi:MFS transporter, DHA1 family, multidrug resistance protein
MGNKPVGGRARLLIVLGGLTAIAPVSIDMYLPALPDLARDLSVSASTAQLTVTACIVGLAGGQVVTGPLSDQLGRRLPLLVCTALYALASLVCVASPSAEVLIAARLGQGIAGSAGVVIARFA